MDVLLPEVNCWRTGTADRVSLIQDAGPYFAHLASAIERARRTIFILGWDLDSRTRLRPEAAQADRRGLLDILLRRLREAPELEVFILAWDYSVLFAFEREPAPRRQFGSAHPRLHFALDADHGKGGSHHQKVVVIDDQVAFVGGIDVTLHRWDNPAHLALDPARVEPNGEPYGPFHDVQLAVSGPIARELGELARARWRTRRRRRPPAVGARASTVAPDRDDATPWPNDLAVDVEGVIAGISRTYTRPGEPAIREVAPLTIRMITSAQRWLYVENQYLTSGDVVRALGARLADPRGPEVTVVLPQNQSGWLEEASMGLLRDEAVAHLRRKDRHGRLRLVCPVVSGVPINVHAKVLVSDDRVAKIGSSNLSNRSMGLDSECDLAVEATDERGAAFVASVRERLLGEHAGLAPTELGRYFAGGGSLIGLVDHLTISPSRARGFVPLSSARDVGLDLTLLGGAVVDPPEPLNSDLLLERAIPAPLRRRLLHRWATPVALAAGMLLAWGVWRHVGAHGDQIQRLIRQGAAWLAGSPVGAFAAVVLVAVAGMVMVPITLLATTVLGVFGLWPGLLIAWWGATLGAMGSRALGARVGRRALDRLPQRPVARVRRFLRRRGFWSVVLVRMLPVGNFGLSNLLAGAIGVPRRAFLFGNLVGLLPGLLGLGVLVDRARAAIRNPSPVNVGIAVAVALLGVGVGVLLKHRLGHARARYGESS